LSLKLRVREYLGGARKGTVTETLALTSSWQQLTVVYTPVALGSILDFEAYTSNSSVGACYQADDASITLNVGPPPSPPAATMSTVIRLATSLAATTKRSINSDDELKHEKVSPLLTGLRSTTQQIKSIDYARDGRRIIPEISIERIEATDVAMADHIGLSLIEKTLFNLRLDLMASLNREDGFGFAPGPEQR
jgi:hypothetical protein